MRTVTVINGDTPGATEPGHQRFETARSRPELGTDAPKVDGAATGKFPAVESSSSPSNPAASLIALEDGVLSTSASLRSARRLQTLKKLADVLNNAKVPPPGLRSQRLDEANQQLE